VSFKTAHYPLPVRALNAAGGILRALGWEAIALSETSLLDRARRETGLSDFGDEGFREGLRVLLESYERDASLHTLGRLRARNDCTRLLSSALRIQRDLKRHPEILDERIRQPIFILGLPRTGTTLLHNLLAADPAHRSLRTWECLRPSPPPDASTLESDPRRAEAERGLASLAKLAPELAAIHKVEAAGPAECVALLRISFRTMAFETSYHVPGYSEWLDRQDMRPVYATYREVLQLLQWRCPGERWSLKSPAHLFALDALLEHFPDACIVQTHRDPSVAIASQCSLVAVLRAVSSDAVDPHAIGRDVPERFARGMERAMTVRETADPTRFYDVHYRDLLVDPLGVVRALYRNFGLELSDEAARRQRAWLAANPQGKHGSHQYAPEDFGLDAATQSRRWAAYRDRFGVEEAS
jgi:hypothetical protein